MPEELIKDNFTKFPFNNPKLPIIVHDCKDEGCELSGDFNGFIRLNGDNIMSCLKNDYKSVDRIIFLKNVPNKKLDIILCELCYGEKSYNYVLNKIKDSGQYIYNFFIDNGFKIGDFKCVYVGDYANPGRVKSKAFSIPGFHRNDLLIKRFKCGTDFLEVLDKIKFSRY